MQSHAEVLGQSCTLSLGETIQPHQGPHPCAGAAPSSVTSHRPFSFPLTLCFQFHLKLQVHPLPPLSPGLTVRKELPWAQSTPLRPSSPWGDAEPVPRYWFASPQIENLSFRGTHAAWSKAALLGASALGVSPDLALAHGVNTGVVSESPSSPFLLPLHREEGMMAGAGTAAWHHEIGLQWGPLQQRAQFWAPDSLLALGYPLGLLHERKRKL